MELHCFTVKSLEVPSSAWSSKNGAKIIQLWLKTGLFSLVGVRARVSVGASTRFSVKFSASCVYVECVTLRVSEAESGTLPTSALEPSLH